MTGSRLVRSEALGGFWRTMVGPDLTFGNEDF
jgi:hypothetical protein